MSICNKCKKDIQEVGQLSYVINEYLCSKCKSEKWEEKESGQFYTKLFVKCPFCETIIDISKNKELKNCPKCNVIIEEPGYCGFCECGYTFRKERGNRECLKH